MIWPTRTEQFQIIRAALTTHSTNRRPLPGVEHPRARDSLALQIIASCRREEYYRLVQVRPISPRRTDPHDTMFNPERAVAAHLSAKNVDEASWLVFLMTHFARPPDSGWLRLRDVYGKLGTGNWDWQSVSPNPSKFIAWLRRNHSRIGGKFGSHRKYETLNPESRNFTGFVVGEYVKMIGQQGHNAFIQNVLAENPNDRFDAMYDSMNVHRFGRLGKFDYLMLLSRYNIIAMQPTSAYLKGATGPIRGARLLFTGYEDSGVSPNDLQQFLDELDNDLCVGMAVLEDALCNWQKNPLDFIHFKG